MTTKAADQLNSKVTIWVSQMAGMIALADRLGKPLPDLSSYQKQILELYRSEFELAKLLDTSDMVVHVNGPSIYHDQADLGTVTHLFSNVDKQIRRLAQSVLRLAIDDQKKAMSMLDVRLTGIAPGSLYAGFSIEPPPDNALLGTEEEKIMFAAIKSATLSVTHIPGYIKNDGYVSEALAQEVTDPAVRDSALLAAFHLSPTGRSGISSIDFINPAESKKSSTLDASHRQLLREVTHKNPLIQSRTKQGTFTGLLTKIDLDKSRVDLRDIGAKGFDSIRCILPTLTVEKGRQILGQRVEITGRYETTPLGKPSLLQIEGIKVIEQLSLKER
jgi:hypothetical protein